MPDYDLADHAGGRRLGLLRPARPRLGEAAFETGEDELIVLPLEGGAEVTVDGETFTLARPRRRVRRPDRLRLRAARRARGDQRRRARGAALLARVEPPRAALRRRGRDRAPRRRADEPPDQQLLRARHRLRRPPDRGRGDHAGRQLVVLPAAQARRGHPRRRDRARGDLLLRGRRRRLRLPARVRPGHRHPRGGPLRRPRAAAERLPRPVDGRARLRPLLPERDGRARRARVAASPTTRPTPGSATPGKARTIDPPAAPSTRHGRAEAVS